MVVSAASAAFFACVIALTVLLTKFWYARPEAFPELLRSLGNSGIDALGVESSEVAADIELSFVFLVSLVLALVLCLVARMLWRKLSAQREA